MMLMQAIADNMRAMPDKQLERSTEKYNAAHQSGVTFILINATK